MRFLLGFAILQFREILQNRLDTKDDQIKRLVSRVQMLENDATRLSCSELALTKRLQTRSVTFGLGWDNNISLEEEAQNAVRDRANLMAQAAFDLARAAADAGVELK